MKKAAQLSGFLLAFSLAVVFAVTAAPKQWFIKWDPNPTNDLVSSYVIREATNIAGPWLVIGQVDSNAVQYAIGEAIGARRFFVVTASNLVGESPFSEIVFLPAVITNGVAGVRFLQDTNH